MPTIVEAGVANADAFTSAIGGHARRVSNLEELKRGLAEDPHEYAVVLGPSVDLDAATAFADSLRVSRPATSVILVRRRMDTGVLAEALRSGMREVVEERDLGTLAQAVKRARQVWEAVHGSRSDGGSHAKARLLTVFSPKGGVGKTTLAVNLALALAQEGKRVCLVDLDLAFGDVAITLQLFPLRTLSDAVPLESGLDVDSIDQLLTEHRDGIHTLVAPVQPDAKDTIRASLVSKVLTLLKQRFEYVVVDTAPTFDEHVLQAIDETDELLLVTTMDVPTLKNVKVAIETLDLLSFPADRRRLVLNRADDKVGLTVEKIESTLGMKVSARIPTSPQVASATNAGEPIVSSSPRHAVSKAIAALAESVQGGSDSPQAAAEPGRRAAPKRALLRRSR